MSAIRGAEYFAKINALPSSSISSSSESRQGGNEQFPGSKTFYGKVRFDSLPTKSWRRGAWIFYKRNGQSFLRVEYVAGGSSHHRNFSLSDLKSVPAVPYGRQLLYEIGKENVSIQFEEENQAENQARVRAVIAVTRDFRAEESIRFRSFNGLNGFGGTKKSIVKKATPAGRFQDENQSENVQNSLVSESIRRRAIFISSRLGSKIDVFSDIDVGDENKDKENLVARTNGTKRAPGTPRPPLEDIRKDGISAESFYGAKDNHENVTLRRKYLPPGLKRKPPIKKSMFGSSYSITKATNTRLRTVDNLEQISFRSSLSGTPLKQNSLKGFANLGNTCYMNAILQALFDMDPFAKEIYKLHEVVKSLDLTAPYPLLKSLVQLLLEKNSVVSADKKRLLNRIKSAISSTAERFSGCSQQDAHEFLCQVLDQLKSETKTVTDEYEEKIEESEIKKEMRNPVQDNIEFTVAHDIICMNCENVIQKEERCLDLPLNMPISTKSEDDDKPVDWNIQDMVNLFFEKEFVEYKCESCQADQSVITHKFQQLPRILVVFLKRYSYDAVLSSGQKLVEEVSIPKFITLDYHCDDKTRQSNCVPQSTKKVKLSPVSDADQVPLSGFEKGDISLLPPDSAPPLKKRNYISSSSPSTAPDQSGNIREVSPITDQRSSVLNQSSSADGKAKRKLMFEGSWLDEKSFYKGINVEHNSSLGENGTVGDGKKARLEEEAPMDENPSPEMDEDLKRAIELSMAEINASKAAAAIEQEDDEQFKTDMQRALELSALEASFSQDSVEYQQPMANGITGEATVDESNRPITNGHVIEASGADLLGTINEERELDDEEPMDTSERPPESVVSGSGENITPDGFVFPPRSTPVKTSPAETKLDAELVSAQKSFKREPSLELIGHNLSFEKLQFNPVGGDWQDAKCKDLRLEKRAILKFPGGKDRVVGLSRACVPGKTVAVEPDGNCFFRALSYWITGVEEEYGKLREAIMSFVVDNCEMFARFEGKQVADMQEQWGSMFQDGQWATQTEILAAACLLNTEIYTYTRVEKSGGCQWLKTKPRAVGRKGEDGQEPEVGKGGKAIYLVNKHKHFEPVLSIRNCTEKIKREKHDGCANGYSSDEDGVRNAAEEAVKKNAESGEMPNSYRLSAVINHEGSMSSSGHYFCDVRDFKEGSWRTCDDSCVTAIDEETVRIERTKTAYILFYVNKNFCNSGTEKKL